MPPHQLASLVSFHRKRAALSQTELAEYAEVSRYVIQDIEAGSGRTTWRKVCAVLKILNLQLTPVGPLVDEWKSQKGDII